MCALLSRLYIGGDHEGGAGGGGGGGGSSQRRKKCVFKGHEFEPSISCSLHISWNLWKIFIKFWSNVHLSEMMCRTHNSTMQTQDQGHNWRPPVWALNFEVVPLSFCGRGYSCPSDCLIYTEIWKLLCGYPLLAGTLYSYCPSMTKGGPSCRTTASH